MAGGKLSQLNWCSFFFFFFLFSFFFEMKGKNAYVQK